jgi:hypothetical protein
MPSDRNARSSVAWSEDPRTPDFMLRALAPSCDMVGLVEGSYADPVLMPVGLCVVSFTALCVSWPYTEEACWLVLGVTQCDGQHLLVSLSLSLPGDLAHGC